MRSTLTGFMLLFALVFVSGCGGCRSSPLGNDDPDSGETSIDGMLPNDNVDASQRQDDAGGNDDAGTALADAGNTSSDANTGDNPDANGAGNSDGGTVSTPDGGSGGSGDGGTTECYLDSDCPAGEVCEDGTCVCDGGDDEQLCASSGNHTWLCHYPPGNTANPQNICVGTPSFLAAHQAHGDTLGDCP